MLAVVELGSLATAASLIAADRLSLPVLNADCTGRSIPELGLTKMDLSGQGPTPLALVDRFGGAITISGSAGAAMADRLARQMSRAVHGRGLATIAYPAKLKDFSKGLVTKKHRQGLDVGRILGGHEPAEQRFADLLRAIGGRLICRAQVRETRWRSFKPYGFREFDYLLDGLGDHANSDVRIFVKNEHHAIWVGGVMKASSLDIIAVLDARDLRPLTTLGDVTDGLEVLVVACPVLDVQWKSEAGRRLLGRDDLVSITKRYCSPSVPKMTGHAQLREGGLGWPDNCFNFLKGAFARSAYDETKFFDARQQRGQ